LVIVYPYSPQMADFYVKKGLLDRKRLLRLMPRSIEFELNDSKDNLFVELAKNDIVAFKYKQNALIFYEFQIGTNFKIDIQKKDGGSLKIHFKTYFTKNNDLYSNIMDVLWKYYFCDLYLEKIAMFNQRITFNIAPLNYEEAGVSFENKGKKSIIHWDDLAIKRYYTYFAVYAKSNPETNCLVDFSTYWNAEINYLILESLISSFNK